MGEGQTGVTPAEAAKKWQQPSADFQILPAAAPEMRQAIWSRTTFVTDCLRLVAPAAKRECTAVPRGAPGMRRNEGRYTPPPPPPRGPSLRPATVPLTPSASLKGICNRQQPPPNRFGSLL